MFEILITLCLEASHVACRDSLLPNSFHQTIESCMSHLGHVDTSAYIESGFHIRETTCVKSAPGLPVHEVAPGVFVHAGQVAEPNTINRGDVANLGFVVGQNSVAIIDTGAAAWIGEALMRAVRRVTDLQVSHVILTHMHPDHVLGTAAFTPGPARIVGHRNLPRALADRAQNYSESLSRLIGAQNFIGSRVVLPDLVVDQTRQIDLGGRVLRLQTWPTAHTGTDLTVLDETTGTLFAGDLVFDRHLPALDGSLLGWQAVIRDLQEQQIIRVIPGHGASSLDWPAGAANLARYLDVLTKDARTAIQQGQRLGVAINQIGASEAENWDLFEAYNPRNATVAYTELEWE